MILAEKIIISLLLGIIGIIIVVLGIYFKLLELKYKKEAVKTSFKVKNVEVDFRRGTDNEILEEIYITTFSFTYKNKKLEEKLSTKNKFEKDQELVGLYLPEARLNKISVAGEGYNMPKGRATVLNCVGILFLIISTLVVFGFKLITLIISLIIIILVFCISYLVMKKALTNK